VAGGGQWVVEALPEEARADWDVFAGASGLALMRSIKERFDPDAILNPGRFAGRI
jgi:glycolate oxidase FAD binding subunit